MKISRRRFLHGAALGATAVALPILRNSRAYAANDAIRLAVIGLNNRGRNHLDGFGPRVVVTVCDVDKTVLGHRAKELGEKGFKVSTETDFRRLLDRKDIDAVSIATPNHAHSWIAILAAQAGKDVYVEKPVSHDIWEGRQLVNAARKFNRIIQAGTQSRSSPSLMAAVEWVRSGKLGKIQYAVGTCFKPRPSIGKLSKPLVIPTTIDYDLWCGPAAKVALYRPHLHYDWHWDFNTGNGDLGNQGIHQMDIARWFLGESTVAPRVFSVGGRLGYSDAGNTANTQIVYHAYEKAPLIFDTRGLPSSKAGQKHWGTSMDTWRGSQVGVIVQCEHGHLLIPSYAKAIAYGKDGHEIKTWSGGGDHFGNFLAAVRSRKPSDLHAEIHEGHVSSALCHTGNVSYRVGQRAPAKVISDELKSVPLAAEAFQRMAAHLHANEIDIEQKTVTLGPWLEVDVKSEQFINNDKASALFRRGDVGRPYVVPEINA